MCLISFLGHGGYFLLIWGFGGESRSYDAENPIFLQKTLFRKSGLSLGSAASRAHFTLGNKSNFESVRIKKTQLEETNPTITSDPGNQPRGLEKRGLKV